MAWYTYSSSTSRRDNWAARSPWLVRIYCRKWCQGHAWMGTYEVTSWRTLVCVCMYKLVCACVYHLVLTYARKCDAYTYPLILMHVRMCEHVHEYYKYANAAWTSDHYPYDINVSANACTCKFSQELRRCQARQLSETLWSESRFSGWPH